MNIKSIAVTTFSEATKLGVDAGFLVLALWFIMVKMSIATFGTAALYLALSFMVFQIVKRVLGYLAVKVYIWALTKTAKADDAPAAEAVTA